ncbi:ABC transporter permease [soil metagenome]
METVVVAEQSTDPRTAASVPPRWRSLLGRQWFLLLLVIVAISVFTGLNNSRFYSRANLLNILEQVSVLGLVAAGATILIVSGNFDISVGAVIGLAAVIMAKMIAGGSNLLLAVGVGIAIGIACSLTNGFLSIAFKAPSFIISLAMIGVYHGIALATTEGTIQTIYGQFEGLGSKDVFGLIPLIFLISVGGYVFIHVIMKHTALGRALFAIGSNPNAAFLAGINVRRRTLSFFALNGLLVGAAAVLLLSRLGAALPSTGTGLELTAIGAAVIGGIPITGGRGDAIGTFFGVLLMGVISNSLNMLRVSPYHQEIATGTVIIGAIGISFLRHRINKNSEL